MSHPLIFPYGRFVADAPKATVMIVDNDFSSRHLLNRLVESLGYQTHQCADGRVAIQDYPHVQPDLILLDYMMPDMDGLEVCRYLASEYGQACAPIIIVTASPDRTLIAEALEAGAFDYITKPFQTDLLRSRISRLLEGRYFTRMIEERNQMLETLNLVARAAVSTLAVDEILERVIYITAHAVDASVAAICNLNLEEDSTTVLADYFDPRAVNLPPSDLGVCYSVSQHFPHLPQWLEQPQGFAVIDVATTQLARSERTHYQAYGVETIVMVFLWANDRLLGYMEYWYQQATLLTPMQLNMLVSSAGQVAMILNNAMLHAQSQDYLRELESRNLELDAYTSTIAHDLKNPIQSFMNLIHFSLEDLGPQIGPPQRDPLEKALQLAAQMGEMIDNLLQLAQVRDTAAVAVPVDMSRVLGDALRRFDLSAQGIEFIAPPELPICLGHAPWLEEVFANLLSNAIKYIGQDNPRPTIAVVGTVQGRQARYEVRDNGIGIPAAQQATIFEHFTRLSNAGHIKGSGLGLSIVQRIVTKLGGQVGVDSQSGQGSTFWFSLPLP